MYIAGRLRTGSSPSKAWSADASYPLFSDVVFCFGLVVVFAVLRAMGVEGAAETTVGTPRPGGARLTDRHGDVSCPA